VGDVGRAAQQRQAVRLLEAAEDTEVVAGAREAPQPGVVLAHDDGGNVTAAVPGGLELLGSSSLSADEDNAELAVRRSPFQGREAVREGSPGRAARGVRRQLMLSDQRAGGAPATDVTVVVVPLRDPEGSGST
jgi:hypothetical protein